MTTRAENIKKINDQLEMLTDEQLDQVAGGTVKQFEEICGAMAKNPTLKALLEGTSHIPLGNLASRDIVEHILKDKLNIDADISLGWGGTGLFSKDNKYTDLSTGQSISHQEVLHRIDQIAYK